MTNHWLKSMVCCLFETFIDSFWSAQIQCHLFNYNINGKNDDGGDKKIEHSHSLLSSLVLHQHSEKWANNSTAQVGQVNIYISPILSYAG